MAQHLKDDVRARIEEAALRVFAARGFSGATMAAVAREAGTATGNVYHYYADKTTLFEAVVPDDFVRRFATMIRRRVRALDGVSDVAELGAGAPFHALAEELLAFSIEHRLRVVVLMGSSDGTRHEGFSDELVRALERLAIAHFRPVGTSRRVTADIRFALGQVYRNWARTMVATLETFDSEAEIRAAVGAYTRYHLAGLNHLFATGT